VVGAPLVAGDRVALVGAVPRGTVLHVRALVAPRSLRDMRIALPAGRLSGAAVLVRGSHSRPRLVLKR